MSEEPKSALRIQVGFAVVRIALGALLLVAAYLKAVALLAGESPGPVFSSPRWQVAIIEMETLLSLWLLSGVYPRGAWLAAIGVFTALAGVAFYLALDGQQWCKCFGAAKVSPWASIAIDSAAVLALLVWRPTRQHGPSPAWLRATF